MVMREVIEQLRIAWLKNRWRRAAFRAARLSLCLQEAHARARERVYAPGGTGFVEAWSSIEARHKRVKTKH